MLVVALDGEVDLVFGGDGDREGEDEEEEERLEERTRHAILLWGRFLGGMNIDQNGKDRNGRKMRGADVSTTLDDSFNELS